MNRRHHAVFSPALDLHGDVLSYGHWGRPLIAFPSQQGKAWFTEDTFLGLMRLRGMESNAPSRHAEGFFCRKLVLGTGP